MARLPTPGSDDGTWGDILNDFLQVAHDTSGTLKANSVDSSALQDNSVAGAKIQDDSITVAKLDTNAGSNGQVLTRDSGASSGFDWATAPVTSVAGKTGAVTLAKADVGLANVDNTSDTNKPVSTAQQTALDGKVNVINGGGETYFDAGNSGTAITLNLSNGNVQKLTLTDNCTLTLASPATGAMRSLTLLVFQDGTGSRTITWPGTVKWGIASTPTLTTTASRMDIISLFTVDGGTNWYGALGAKGY
ncbi:MAG TPA: hypothetical protein VFZ48_03305 [Candidatus Saccharimonadales bacterium]